MPLNYLYEFWSPEGDYDRIMATVAEERLYNIISNMLMEVAFNCYSNHQDKYKNVADVLGKCYYTKTLVIDDTKTKENNWFRLTGYTPCGENNSWIVVNGLDSISQFEHWMKEELTAEWWPEHKDIYDNKEDFYYACYCRIEKLKNNK